MSYQDKRDKNKVFKNRIIYNLKNHLTFNLQGAKAAKVCKEKYGNGVSKSFNVLPKHSEFVLLPVVICSIVE